MLMRLCAEPHCPVISDEARCPEHRRQRERRRGTPQQRGYDLAHRRERARWALIVAQGHTDCHAARCLFPTRRILPGTLWDLGHTPDRTTWTGPEHARCNRAAGGRAAHH